jgi:hypothetical protein
LLVSAFTLEANCDGGQNSGDAGGTHAAEVTIPPFAIKASAPSASGLSTPNLQPSTASGKREFTAEQKTACSIEAMRNGGECEACQ